MNSQGEGYPPDAVRVDHIGAAIPSPTSELILALAKAIYASVTENHGFVNEQSFPAWDNLAEDQKAHWIEGARMAFATIALHGGARAVPIRAQ